MKQLTFNTDKQEAFTTINDFGDYKLNTSRDHNVFVGDNAENVALDQAKALAIFYSKGCFKVYEDADVFTVQFDECKVRGGVEDDFIAQYNTNSGSGCCDWLEAKTFNISDCC